MPWLVTPAAPPNAPNADADPKLGGAGCELVLLVFEALDVACVESVLLAALPLLPNIGSKFPLPHPIKKMERISGSKPKADFGIFSEFFINSFLRIAASFTS